VAFPAPSLLVCLDPQGFDVFVVSFAGHGEGRGELKHRDFVVVSVCRRQRRCCGVAF